MVKDRIIVRQQALLEQCMRDFDARWDEEAGLLSSEWGGASFHGTRESVYYALGLLERGRSGDLERAETIIRNVAALQRDCPGQPWHGTFASAKEQPCPPCAPEAYGHMSSEAYALFLRLWSRTGGRFREMLEDASPGDGRNRQTAALLNSALDREWPAVWDTYDPNWREFITSVFALILENFESVLHRETCAAMEHAACLAIDGAVERIKRDYDPLNTNIWIIHILMCEMFAARLGKEDLMAWAEEKAAALLEEYQRDGAVAEFNSPTYNGVVLTFAPLMRKYCRGPAAGRLGKELENGLWSDLADFYNPAMKNLCGPYSRCYEMDMTVHTAIPMLLYLGFLWETLPPFSIETESAPLMFLAEPQIPDAAKQKMVCSDPNRVGREVMRTFRELCEREFPEARRSLCTATAYISDELMIGALSGSINTSHQLHPLTVFWRGTDNGLYAMKLLRTDMDGKLMHMHTVFFDLVCEKKHVAGTIRNRSGQTVKLVFDFEYLPDRETASPKLRKASVEAEKGNWFCEGLDIRTDLRVDKGSDTLEPQTEKKGTAYGDALSITLEDGGAVTMELDFDLPGEVRQ